jgi:DNA-binding FadR family transcriptional regulator
VLQKEVSKDPAARWIASGTAGWVTRLLILRETSPQVAERYTLAEQQRLASQGKLQQVKLEQWPSDNDGAYVLAAARVFRNIAEKHGNPAVTQVLTAFWRLPPAQRTSKSFRKLYQQLLKEPVEAEAPESTLSP